MALQEVLKQLPGELAAQEEHVREMGKVLKARKGLWRCTRSTMVGAYLQHCILPRVTYSPADAAFCAAFMRRLIELSVPWFHAFLYLDAVRAMRSSDTTPSDAYCISGSGSATEAEPMHCTCTQKRLFSSWKAFLGIQNTFLA